MPDQVEARAMDSPEGKLLGGELLQNGIKRQWVSQYGEYVTTSLTQTI